MNRFLKQFRSLPPAAQEEILTVLHQMLKERGHPSFFNNQHHILNIADVFFRNGKEIEEYT